MTDQAAEVPPADPRRGRRLWRVVRWTAAVVALLLVVVAIGGFLSFRHLDANIEALHPDLGTNRPDPVIIKGVKHQPLNILLIGSDTRSGQSSLEGNSGGDLSDTTILLHISASRERAYGVSIPRDLIVRRPDCPSKSNPDVIVPGSSAAMFNTAYGVGHEGCTVRTVEAMTNIRIDHFIVTTFDGFRDVSDALGGVQVCVPSSMHDPRFDITLPPGRYDVQGLQALVYVSMRKGVGDGSDIGRMKRQQAFLAAMTKKAVSADTLANPFRLYAFLDEATKAVAVDEGLASLSKLASLGRELKGIGLDKVQFLTMPFGPYAPDPNRLAIGPGAAELWRKLRFDEKLTPEQLSGGASAGNAAYEPRLPQHSFGGDTAAPAIKVPDLESDRYGLCTG